MSLEKSEIIKRACTELRDHGVRRASQIIRESYPFQAKNKTARRFTRVDLAKTFIRDGCIDRYSGERLVYPGALLVLSTQLPKVFPYQKNWKVSETHMAYWELFPTLDHIEAVAFQGADDSSNWVSTSMMRNSAKAHWRYDQIGWSIHPCGKLTEWDGLVTWFLEYMDSHPELHQNRVLREWQRVGRIALNEHRQQ